MLIGFEIFLFAACFGISAASYHGRFNSTNYDTNQMFVTEAFKTLEQKLGSVEEKQSWKNVIKALEGPNSKDTRDLLIFAAESIDALSNKTNKEQTLPDRRDQANRFSIQNGRLHELLLLVSGDFEMLEIYKELRKRYSFLLEYKEIKRNKKKF